MLLSLPVPHHVLLQSTTSGLSVGRVVKLALNTYLKAGGAALPAYTHTGACRSVYLPAYEANALVTRACELKLKPVDLLRRVLEHAWPSDWGPVTESAQKRAAAFHVITRVRVPQSMYGAATADLLVRGLDLLRERYPHGLPLSWEPPHVSPSFNADWGVPQRHVQLLCNSAYRPEVLTRVALELALAEKAQAPT